MSIGSTLVEAPTADPSAVRAPCASRPPCAPPAAKDTERAFWRSKTARSMAAAAILLMAVEATVRLREHVVHGQSGTEVDLYKVDPVLGKLPRAGAQMVSGSATTTINRWGMRGHDVALEKPPGVTRILCLGESTTFGQPGDDDVAIWPARLEHLLNADAGDNAYEVLNGSAAGYTVYDSRLQFDHRLAQFEPDAVIIYHAATNITAHARRQFAREEAASQSLLTELRDRYSLAYVLLRANTAALLESQFAGRRHDHLNKGTECYFRDDLAGLIDDCRQRGCKVIVCTFPHAFDARQQPSMARQLAASALYFNPQLTLAGLIDAYDRYNDAIRQIATDHGAVLADLDRQVSRGSAPFVDSVHLSASGHTQVAQILNDVIEPLMTNRTAAREVQPVDAVQ